jgi:hypothetical protein
MYPCNNPNIPLLLVCILHCTAFLLPATQAKVAKSGKAKLQLKVHSKQEKVEPEQTVIYEGLPGEVEYEVDLSDQETARNKEGRSDQSEVGR